MPAISSTLLLDHLAVRNITFDSATSSIASNATTVSDVMQVVCAWPVSGQYGPGSRALYYALVAACVFARKAEWLRNACLAAALIFPAVAAIHGIVLAALHVDGAVDMDVYGAFQFCSIGILAAPLTVRLSRTYFYDPGRNIIFLWTGIVLAGLLSLTVEFFRTQPSACPYDNSGNPIAPYDYDNFPYENANCSMICSVAQGPFSPLRQHSTNEIFIIPAPSALAFNAATLLAAACCIPAVLSLVSMWNKILEINWKTRFGPKEKEDEDEPISGTNGATVEKMSSVNTVVRLFLSTLEIPIFSAAVLAILIFGERNFFSRQVEYQTEPINSIGQWAPIVGTILAALGSLYVLLAVDLEVAKEDTIQRSPTRHCNCSHHHIDHAQSLNSHNEPSADTSIHNTDAESVHGDTTNITGDSPAIREDNHSLYPSSSNSITVPDATHSRLSSSHSGRKPSAEITSTEELPPTDIGGRRKVARTLMAIGNYLGTASQDRFDYSEFKHGKALDFPEVPAEEQRNPDLRQIREAYNQHRDEDDITPALSKRPSRTGSFTGSIVSKHSISMEGSPTMSRAISAPYSQSLQSQSPSPPRLGVRHSNTLPAEKGSIELQSPGPSSADLNRVRERQRRDTLEVPAPVHTSTPRDIASVSPGSPIEDTIITCEGSPRIVISSDPDSIDEISILSPPIITPPPLNSAPSSQTTTSTPP
ncbi:hypothetical protein GGS26DRAFT_427974 [Hypomontagnella submonticulosa]|nr:hypothetical protein GGS26DRAFT_427974 [Hypomontagnella submonticulosa]